MNHEAAVQTLRRKLEQIDAKSTDTTDQIGAQIRDAKGSVIARYAPLFSPENLDALSDEDFRGFLLFKNNQHWDSLHRQGGWMTADMPKLREAIGVLVDEGLPLKTRLDRLRPPNGDPMVKGLGRAVITAILQVVFPDKYGVLNNTAEAGMRALDLWPDFKRGASFGDKYEAVNRVLLQVAPEVGTDLWTLDMLWWRVANMHVPKGSGVTESGARPDVKVLPVDIEEEAAEVSFGLERHLQDFLVDNWDSTDIGRKWQLLEEDGEVVGALYNTGEVGEIDLLARHRKDDSWLIIELKRNQTSDATVGQILRYMGWVRRNLALGAAVKGLIICRDVDLKLRYALEDLPNIECQTYAVNFVLNPVPSFSSD